MSPNQPTLLTRRARGMRSEPTIAEQKLWISLRNQQFAGLKFRRQVPVGSYIADFLCFEKMLIIEADGDQHGENRSDSTRDMWLTSQGYIVMRFSNHDILSDIESVLATIARELGLVW